MNTKSQRTGGNSKLRFGPDVTAGRRPSPARAARGALAAALRHAGDKLAAMHMRMRGDTETTDPVPRERLVEAWRQLAQADSLAADTYREHLCYQTLASWPRLSFSDRVLLFDAWGFTAQRFPSFFVLPRPLLRAVSSSMWRDGAAASVQELNLVAVRTGPFFKVTQGRMADLARSILDAVIHHAAAHVEGDYKAAAGMGPCLSMAAWASRCDATQRELHAIREAASDARSPLEEAIYQQIALVKCSCRCDSITAQSRVAAALARDSLQHGGDIRTSFIKAFGHAPESAEEHLASTEQALEEWRIQTAARQLQAAAAAPEDGAVEASALSMYTVHSDGRSQAAGPSP